MGIVSEILYFVDMKISLFSLKNYRRLVDVNLVLDDKQTIWMFEKLIAAEGIPDYASMLPWDAPKSCRFETVCEEDEKAA